MQTIHNTALVAVPAPAAPSASVRPRAPFLAQLIATARLLPQTRARRRALTAEAVRCYDMAAAPPPRPEPGRMSRCI